MRVISPSPVTDAVLVSSSVVENDYPEWSSGATYGVGARVMKTATHRVYESAVVSNVGHDPAATAEGKWIDIGPTNRWAMLDQAVGTATVSTSQMQIALRPGGIASALAIIDTDAETVQVQINLEGTIIYDQTKTTNVAGAVVADWSAYFFTPVGKVMALLFLDLPQSAGATMIITITGSSLAATVSVGTLLVGTVIDVGTTEAGPSVGITDFSRKDTDQFGVTTVVERAWAKRMTIRSLVETSAVDAVQRNIAALRARPALWIGAEGYDSLTIYGFFKDFSIDLTVGMDPETRQGGQSFCSFTIEGLI